MKKALSTLGTLLLSAALLAGCGGKPATSSSGAAAGAAASHKTKGTVTVAIPQYTYDETVELIKSFQKSYPGIQVKTVSFDGDPTEYLTAQSLNKSMPDILFEDWDNIPFYISQGWLMPLNKYFDADSEKQYVPQSLISDLTYGGKLYALPCKIEFEAIFMNMDLLDTLNLDPPKYNWTVSDFTKLMKAATTTKYSGIEKLWGFDEKIAAQSVQTGSLYGYDITTHTFNFTKSWVPAVSTLRELRAVPGLEAWSLRGADNAQYVQKFGDGDTSDMEMAFKTGSVLCDAQVTSERGWMRMMPFTVDVYPIPFDEKVGEKIGVHANSSYMLSTCKDPEAAFQLLKWLTYGVEGQKIKLQTFLSRDADDPYSGLLEYFSPTTHPDIANMLQKSDKVLGGLKYLASHMNNIYRADLGKIVPNWDQINKELISPQTDPVRDGTAEAAAVAAELDQKANEQMSQTYSDFEKRLK